MNLRRRREVEIATRRVARRVTVVASDTQRHFFGPFLPGQRVEGFWLYLTSDAAAPVSGEFVQVQVKAFTHQPPDTAAAFAANGRPLTGASAVAADQPVLPLQGSIVSALVSS